jgi:ribosomally synthesized peptide (two-chain TOMM family)
MTCDSPTVDVPKVDSLLEFRTVWLSAIAKAWIEPSFRQVLLTSSPTEKVLSDTFLYPWPWQDTLTLRVVDAEGFEWVGDDWIWPSATPAGEGLTLYVPLEPPTGSSSHPLSPEEQATALADYYRLRPSLLTATGPLKDWGFNVSSAFLDHLKAPPSPIVATQHGSPEPQGGFVPNDAEFANFEVALLYAISKAWENSAFRRYLQDSPQFAIASCHGYHPPWPLPLRIQNDTGARWQPHSKDPFRKWQNLSPTVLTLSLPQKPEEVREYGIALAAYNATGAQYPFSCCP